jgi:hypothetical protein
MSMRILEAIVVSEQHLAPNDIAAYVDRAATGSRRARIESHLATCAECRAEVSDAARIINTLPPARSSRQRAIISAAAIAATLLFFVLPRAGREPPGVPHRESGITTTVAPVIITPTGAVGSATIFSWTSVPHADSYDVRIFDSDGSVAWGTETTDTVVTPPASIALRAGRSYYWKVEARTGFDRKTASELVGFSIRRPQPQ